MFENAGKTWFQKQGTQSEFKITWIQAVYHKNRKIKENLFPVHILKIFMVWDVFSRWGHFEKEILKDTKIHWMATI